MYDAAQRRQNIIVSVIVVVLAVLLVVSYLLLTRYTTWDLMGIVGVFMALTGIAYVIIRAVACHTEAVMIHTMVAAGTIALARIDRVVPLREVRDFCLLKHRLYTFDLTVYPPHAPARTCTIVEDVVEGSELPASGTFVYVTYDGRPGYTGIVPTLNIYVSPQLKDVVRALEAEHHPRYLEVVRSRGLIFRPFGKQEGQRPR